MSTLRQAGRRRAGAVRLGHDRLALPAREHGLEAARRDGRHARARRGPRLPPPRRPGGDDHHQAGQRRRSSSSGSRRHSAVGRLGLPRRGRRPRVVQRRRRDGAPAGRDRPVARREAATASSTSRAKSPGHRCASGVPRGHGRCQTRARNCDVLSPTRLCARKRPVSDTASKRARSVPEVCRGGGSDQRRAVVRSAAASRPRIDASTSSIG